MRMAPGIQRARALGWVQIFLNISQIFLLEPGFKKNDLELNIDMSLSCLVFSSNSVLIILHLIVKNLTNIAGAKTHDN